MDELITKSHVILVNTQAFIEQCEELHITDEQWFIDWEIKMSELVTKDHNNKKQ